MLWFERAAIQGDIDSQRDLGTCYFQGKGVDQSYEKAVYWYEKASEQGDKEAQMLLGLCYFTGKGVARSVNRAVYWVEKSCKNYNTKACEYLEKIKP